MKTSRVALFSGLFAVLIGLFMFLLSWNLFDVVGGPLPGYKILLFPANITLTYIWHPLFTEELGLLPKLTMMLLGQFVVVTSIVAISISIISRVFSAKPK